MDKRLVGRSKMAVGSVFVLVFCVAFIRRVNGDSNCPTNCTCTNSKDLTISLNCTGIISLELLENWPKTTAKM